MKNIFKKNQVIITALAIMIAVAGYLNFSEQNSSEVAETAVTGSETTYDADMADSLLDISDEDIQTAEAGQEDALAVNDAAEAEIVSSDDVEVVSSDDTEALADNGEDTEVGEAVLVSNTIGEDFFSSARLTREQTRAKNKEMLLEIVDNVNVSEAQKEEALNGIVALTDIAEKESATEILLEAKGFEDVVVSIVDDSADVIVNANNLTEQQIAQIEDIVKRKTEISAENIVISPVGVEAE